MSDGMKTQGEHYRLAERFLKEAAEAATDFADSLDQVPMTAAEVSNNFRGVEILLGHAQVHATLATASDVEIS